MELNANLFIFDFVSVKYITPIRHLLIVLLVFASVNTCIPWQALQYGWCAFAMNLEEEEEEDFADSEDPSENDGDERDELEKTGFDKDYLKTTLHFAMKIAEGGAWAVSNVSHTHRPVLDILVPPPKCFVELS